MDNNYYKFRVWIGIAALTVAIPAGIAQKNTFESDPKISKVEINAIRETPSLIVFDWQAQDAYTEKDVRPLLQRFFNLAPGQCELGSVKRTEHVAGAGFERFQQYYKGIRVEHGQFTAFTRKGLLISLNGEFYDLRNLDTRPVLTEKQALELAFKSIGASEYVYEYVNKFRNGINAPKIADKLNELYDNYQPKGELVIVDDYSTPESDPALAYKFNIYASEPLSRDWVYVNAQSGKIMLKDAIIKHAGATVNTRYSGQQTIQTTARTGLNPSPQYLLDFGYYVLRDQTRGGGVNTLDMNGLGGAPISVPLLYNLAAECVDDDNSWTTAEHVRDPAPTILEAVNDDIAWDAHFGASMVYDYWKQRHNRLSFDGNNGAINSYVHYGVGYDNAFWDGAEMTYGDGSYQDFGFTQIGSFSPLTSMDVCAHEIGHGVCEHTANLVYERESGAMNEGFSDIWAACVEAYVLQRFPGKSLDYNPWGIGEQIDQSNGFNNLDQALRWMDDPKRASNPDTYGGDFWTAPDCGTPNLVNDYCGVHSNSGLLNKWFYLLTAGSGNAPDDGVNDNGDAYTVSGLGFTRSELIAFGTEIMLSPNATFAEARAASIAYAQAVYGVCSPEEEATTNAWFGVGVGAAFGCEGARSLINPVVNNMGSATVYPNPANDRVFVVIPNTDAEAGVQLKIFDSAGRPLITKSVEGTIPGQSVEIPVADVPAGLYWIGLYDARGAAMPGTAQKLLINRK